MSGASRAASARRMTAKQRLDVALRVVVAVVGAYVFSSLVAATFARFMPGDRANASLTGTIISFAVFPVIVMWAFAVKRVGPMAVTLAGVCAVLGGLVMWSINTGGQL